MKKRIAGLLLLLVSAGVLSGCGQRGEREVIIISTNDIHSAIDRFPNLATLVVDIRENNEGKVLLVDAGDRWTGNPFVDRAPEPCKPVIDLMNELGYDYATFGNHEFDYGLDLLAERTSEASFFKILANGDLSQTPVGAVRPFSLVRVNGVNIALFGLVTITESGHPDGKDENFAGAVFFDPVQEALKYKGLRDSCDLLVAVTHIGLDADKRLAEAMPEIDLIIGGHSHDVIESGRDVNGVVVTQTGKNLVYAGVTTISMRGKKVLSIDNNLVMLDTVAPHLHFSRLVEEIKSEPELLKPAGSTTTALDKTGLLTLFSDMVRVGSGADIAFWNVGGMRIEELPEGDITIADVYSAEPFGNMVVTVEMTMEQVAAMILTKFNSTGKESHTVDLSPSGIAYRIVTDGEGNGLSVHIDYPGPLKSRYKVALSDFVAEQYSYEGKDTAVGTGKTLTDYAFAYLKSNSPVRVPSGSRVEIE